MPTQGYEKWKKDRNRVGIPDNESTKEHYGMRQLDDIKAAENAQLYQKPPATPDSGTFNKDPMTHGPAIEGILKSIPSRKII